MLSVSLHTVRVLDPRALARVGGGATNEFACAESGTATYGSCGCKPKV
jgi:hypothetical protein